MATFQTIIDSARVILNDTGTSYRYTDAQLIGYCNEAILEVKRTRPDFFFGQYTTTLPTYTATSTVPIPTEFQSTLVNYLVGRAEFRDDEFTVDSRASAFMGMFKSGLVSL
jgi:hypothetical protein